MNSIIEIEQCPGGSVRWGAFFMKKTGARRSRSCGALVSAKKRLPRRSGEVSGDPEQQEGGQVEQEQGAIPGGEGLAARFRPTI